jgi:hypothetical protein
LCCTLMGTDAFPWIVACLTPPKGNTSGGRPKGHRPLAAMGKV